MTKQQWDAIRTDSVPDLVRYYVEMRDKGTTTAQIPADIKTIIDKYLAEYKAEETGLHGILHSSPSAKSGCAGRVAALITVISGVAWWALH